MMRKILAIDDLEDNLITIQAVIKSHLKDCVLMTALSGEEGIKIVREERPDVILLDIIMPKMDGFEVCKKLKEDPLTKHIPIIMITAIKTDADSRIKGLKLGADAFLSKPIDPSELSAQVEVMLRIKAAEDNLRVDKKDLAVIVQEKTKEIRAINKNLELEIKERKLAEKALRSIATEFASTSGMEFFEKVCKHLSETLNVDFAFVGKLIKEDTSVEVKAGIGFGKPIDSFKYDLVDTPCANVVEKNACCYPTNVQSLFPKDDLLIEMGIDGYLGIPIFSSSGKIHGIIVLLNTSPIDNESTAVSILQIFADRISAEVERMQAEEDLLKLSTAVKQSPSLILISDLDGKIEYANPKFTQLTGYEFNEVKGQKSNLLNSGEQSDAFYQNLWFQIKTGKEWRGEFQNKKKNGELFWESASISPIFNTEGKITNFIKVAEDITERKNEEKILTIQLKLFEYAIDHSIEELLRKFLDEAEKLTDSQIGFYHFVEDDHETISLQTWSTNTLENMCKSVDDSERHYPISQAGVWVDCVKAGKPIVHNDYSALVHKNGLPEGHAPIYREMVVPVIRGKQIVAILGVGNKKTLYNDHDVKTIQRLADVAWETVIRKQAEKELKESEERFALSMRASKDGLFDWNLLTNNIFYSENWKKMLGYEDHELPNHISTWQKLTQKEGKERSLKKMDWAIKNNILRYEEEFKMKHKDGLWIDIMSRAEFVYNDKKEAIRVVGTHVDITEQREYERNLKDALHKATESDRLKSAFLATMSHELRTPLNAIIGFSEIIKDEYSLEEIKGFNNHIHSSGKHLLTIVEDLFNLTLIESGQISLRTTDEDLSELLSNVQQIIKSEQISLEKQHIEFKVNLPMECNNLSIVTDAAKLRQVLINLLKNALKFTADGFVEFGCKIIKQKKTDLIKFYVKDSGIGIPKDKHELIFNMFRQVEDSHTRVHGGTGIGLSITKKLVHMLGGEILLDSEEGKGSTFYFSLPIILTEKPKDLDLHRATSFGHYPDSNADKTVKKTLLIAEDVESSFELLEIILSKQNLNILWAKNGIEAIDIFKKDGNIDVILMDINMPEMNGFDATKAIKLLNPDVPIIAQTAYAIAGDKEKSIKAGCDDYISKPIKKDELILLLKKHIN